MAQETLIHKARRICNASGVNLIVKKHRYLHARVKGDHNEYDVMLWFKEGQIERAKCGCAWNVLRKKPKHWCSHIRAVLVKLGRDKTREAKNLKAVKRNIMR